MAEESVAVAQVQLDNTVIRAPFTGVVVAKAAQPGEMISPISAGGGFTRTGIGTIVDMDSLEIQVDVNEAFINRVTPGQPVEATLNAYPDWKIPGAVIAIDPHRGPQQGHGEGPHRHQAERPAHRAGHGRAGRVPEPGAGGAARRQAPASSSPRKRCAARATSGRGVRVRGDKVERRKVTLGQTVGANRLVLSGVRDGEHVVLAPPDR